MHIVDYCRKESFRTMDTAVVVLVLILVIALFGFIAWLFVREVGWPRARFLIVSPIVGLVSTDEAKRLQPPATTAVDVTPVAPAIPAVTDEMLRSMREEIQGELVRATNLSRSFDARLTKIESVFGDSRRTPHDLEAAIQDIDTRQSDLAALLRREMTQVQRSTTGFAERRVTAVSDLYGHLARVEASLASVVNPALLPGEPLTLPSELGEDVWNWDTWRNVGDRAYGLGEAFNQHRVMLDEEVSSSMESFITTLRQALTGAVYPNVQNPNPSDIQRAQVKSGIGQIVAVLPEMRRKLELAYRADLLPTKENP